MKNQKELQIIFGSAITASAQLKHTKEDKSIENGTSTPMMNVNRNAIGVKRLDSAHLMKFFN